MSEDRRQHPRVAMTLPVSVRFEGPTEIEVYTGDLSSGGAFLRCNPEEFPPIGSEVEVQAIKPEGDGEPAPVVKAKVVRRTPGGVGIAFILDD